MYWSWFIHTKILCWYWFLHAKTKNVFLNLSVWFFPCFQNCPLWGEESNGLLQHLILLSTTTNQLLLYPISPKTVDIQLQMLRLHWCLHCLKFGREKHPEYYLTDLTTLGPNLQNILVNIPPIWIYCQFLL